MVKWTSLDPPLMLSEIDSKLYTNLDFVQNKYHTHLRDILIYKAKQFIVTKRIP